ncbi:glycosyltransferase family 4 protein [Rhizobium panacihumi]|uniref:glycosyltransferase family 4 protein n=1 Tax=Rhizobium panacihumi TaxID=2008450 RepID=UPI003D7C0E86
MAKRTRIIIPFNYDEGWTGGNYYISNLVASLSLLADDRQPDVMILSHSQNSFEFIVETSGYKRIKWISSLMMNGVDGGLSRRLRLMSKLLPSFLKPKPAFDAIFPFPIDTKERARTICWIPDLQERALPNLFSEEELKYRAAQHQYYIDNFEHILFSSQNALADFERYYPGSRNTKHVMPFAVAPAPVSQNPHEVLQRLEIPQAFFYCPNQFWIHKNHKIVIDAVHQLAQEGVAVTVAFSGKELDRRDPEHVNNLKARVAALGLEQQIRFLGFISKEDQYALIETALALLQPSLFEGWSTVIEEAKSKSQFVLASDLGVHREQLQQNADFFDPHDASDLAQALKRRLRSGAAKNVKIDYEAHRRVFADTFLSIVDHVRTGS